MNQIEVLIGRIGKPHGVRGEVTIDLKTDEPERRFAIGNKLAATPPKDSTSTLRALTVNRIRWHQGTLLVTFDEMTDRNEAEVVRGTLLHATVDTEETPDDPDEFYDHQLIGLAAYDLEGKLLGTVTKLVHGGAQDLLTIRTEDRRDALVPFVSALVPEVDLVAGKVVIADRPGLVTPFDDDDEVDPEQRG